MSPPQLAAAEARGHHMVSDPPAAHTAARRWTCDRGCGHAVIDYRGNVYGSALDHDCITPTVTCDWFAFCTRPAVGTVNHPVIGPVPTCAACADKLDLTLNPLEEK